MQEYLVVVGEVLVDRGAELRNGGAKCVGHIWGRQDLHLRRLPDTDGSRPIPDTDAVAPSGGYGRFGSVTVTG
jgi:hypothetical protein